MRNGTTLFNQTCFEVTPQFEMCVEMAYLTNNLERYYRDCMAGILDGDSKKYQDNYVAINQTHSVLLYMNENCPAVKENFEERSPTMGSGKMHPIAREDLMKKIQDKMYFIQTSKQNWDALARPENSLNPLPQ